MLCHLNENFERKSQIVCTNSMVSRNLWDNEYIQEFDGAQSIAVDYMFTGAVTTRSKQVIENARTAE
jgi:hypothetical protein